MLNPSLQPNEQDRALEKLEKSWIKIYLSSFSLIKIK